MDKAEWKIQWTSQRVQESFHTKEDHALKFNLCACLFSFTGIQRLEAELNQKATSHFAFFLSQSQQVVNDVAHNCGSLLLSHFWWRCLPPHLWCHCYPVLCYVERKIERVVFPLKRFRALGNEIMFFRLVESPWSYWLSEKDLIDVASECCDLLLMNFLSLWVLLHL